MFLRISCASKLKGLDLYLTRRTIASKRISECDQGLFLDVIHIDVVFSTGRKVKQIFNEVGLFSEQIQYDDNLAILLCKAVRDMSYIR